MDKYLIKNGGLQIIVETNPLGLPPPPPAPPAKKRSRNEDAKEENDEEDDDASVEILEDDGATGAKKKSWTGGNPTTNPSTVENWTFHDIDQKPLGNSIWGFHRDLGSRQATRRKKALVELKKGMVYCWWCVAHLKALKTTIAKHVVTDTCLASREAYLRRSEARAKTGGDPVDVEWTSAELMLLHVEVKTLSKTPTSEQKRDPANIQALLVSYAATHSLSFRAMVDLFTKGFFLSNLILLAEDGLGSDKTVADRLQQSIKNIHEKDVRPVFRHAIDNDLPICIASDESPAKGHAVLLAHVFYPGLKEPLCIDVKKMDRACNYERLTQGLKDIVIDNNFLSEDEWKKHVVIFSGDHAAYVIKAAKEAKCEHAGDPAHALDLVVKAVIKACHLQPLCMALRKIFTSKSYVVAALLKAINVEGGGISVMKIPVTRWGYFPRLLRMISSTKELAKLQEAILWMHHHIYGGDLSPSVSSLVWIKGVPFKPDPYEAQSMGETELPEEDGGDWGDERRVKDDDDEEEEVETMGEEEEEDEEPQGVSLKATNERRRKTCLQLLAVLSNPQVITFIKLIGKLTEPLRAAQVEAQRSGTERGAELIENLKGAYDAFAQPLKNEGNYTSWITSCSIGNVTAVDTKLTPRATISRLPNGSFIVHSMPTEPMYTIEYKTQQAMKLATKQIQEQLRAPIHDGARKYEKVVYKCYYVAKRRFLASLVCDIGEHTKQEFNNLLQLDDALPPSLRKENDKTRMIQANGINDDDDFSIVPNATKICTQWNSFMAVFRIPSSMCYLTDDFRRNPHLYWMKVRTVYPELGNTMLYWLAHPVGTAGLERDFSGMTMECRDFRKSRTQWPTFRARVLARCYKVIIAAKLKEALES